MIMRVAEREILPETCMNRKSEKQRERDADEMNE